MSNFSAFTVTEIFCSPDMSFCVVLTSLCVAIKYKASTCHSKLKELKRPYEISCSTELRLMWSVIFRITI